VRERLHAGLPLYEVDEARLAELAPDFIITQTHCEVCAVSPGDLQPQEPSEGSRTLPRRTSLGDAELRPRAHGVSTRLERHQVVALSTGTIEGILEGFVEVAKVLGAAEAGRRLVAGIRDRLAALAARTRPLPPRRVAGLEWIEPLFEMGNWGPEIVEIAGGQSLLSAPGAHSTTVAFEALRDADPEVIVVAPCGFDLPRTLAELPALTDRPDWRDLAAVRAGRAFAADGNFYFNRSGPMLFDTPEILAEMLHPDAFPPRHEGTVWRRLPTI